MSLNKDFSNIENPSLFTSELAERFLNACTQISIFGRQIDININPTTDRRMPLFRSLSLDDQRTILKKAEMNCEIFSALVREKEDLRSSSSLIWMACGRLGLRPPSDFFDKVSDTDLIQVYSQEGVHRFSNLRFFEMCSYTLEQMYTHPWHLLWKRDEQDMAYLHKCAEEILSIDQKKTLVFGGAPQIIRESFSVFKYESEYRLKCAAPLFDRETGMRDGFIVCESGRLLTEHAPLDQERMLLENHENQKGVIQLRSLS